MALGILSQLQSKGKIPPLSEMRHNSGEYLHAIIESLRLAFADTRYYVSDPEVVHVPVEELLSEVGRDELGKKRGGCEVGGGGW